MSWKKPVERTCRKWLITSKEVNAGFEDWNNVRYYCWQVEKGDESGYRHRQIFVECLEPATMGQVKKFVKDNTAHCVQVRRTAEKARAYCMKEETRLEGPWEQGIFSTGQGSRTDLMKMCDDMKSAKSFREVVEKHPEKYVKYNRGMKMLWDMQESAKPAADPSNRADMWVTLIYGKSGQGKSWHARQMAYELKQPCHVLTKNMSAPGVLWWDGYVDQPVVIIDDFNGWIGYKSLLTLTDIYDVRMQVKGGTAQRAYKRVILTSTQGPKDWYPHEFDEQLARRIDEVLVMEEWGVGDQFLREKVTAEGASWVNFLANLKVTWSTEDVPVSRSGVIILSTPLRPYVIGS